MAPDIHNSIAYHAAQQTLSIATDQEYLNGLRWYFFISSDTSEPNDNTFPFSPANFKAMIKKSSTSETPNSRFELDNLENNIKTLSNKLQEITSMLVNTMYLITPSILWLYSSDLASSAANEEASHTTTVTKAVQEAIDLTTSSPNAVAKLKAEKEQRDKKRKAEEQRD